MPRLLDFAGLDPPPSGTDAEAANPADELEGSSGADDEEENEQIMQKALLLSLMEFESNINSAANDEGQPIHQPHFPMCRL